MMIPPSIFRRFALVLALLGAGCGSSPKTQLYSLQAAAIPQMSDAGRAESLLHIVIGPVTLPERVDRPQIVTLTGEHSVHASDFNRWAEPLKVAFPRQLVADLGQELGSTRVRLQGQEVADATDLRIEVDVLRFDAVLADSAVIEAMWTIRRKGQPPRSGRSIVRERVTAEGYAGLVAGLGRATAGVGRDLAVAVRELRRER